MMRGDLDVACGLGWPSLVLDHYLLGDLSSQTDSWVVASCSKLRDRAVAWIHSWLLPVVREGLPVVGAIFLTTQLVVAVETLIHASWLASAFCCFALATVGFSVMM